MRDKRYVVHSKKNENSETTISSTIQDSRQWTNYAALLSKDCRYHFHSFCFIFTGSTNFMVSFVYFMHALDFFVSTAHWSILTLKKWQPAIQNATGMRMEPSTIVPPANAMTFHSHFTQFNVRVYRTLFRIFVSILCMVSGWQQNTPTEMTVNAYADYAWIPASSTNASVNIHFLLLSLLLFHFLRQETTRHQPFSQLEIVSTKSLLNIATISNLS